ncbi:histone-lysine N-methyltransferase [Trypanosoma grayi]|uniref:histone-lysine N-methyltransferase n=1 Tax=Trypanosoma grayi TaxID=71804 RepID=UPI0004F420FF|nr:histone-lysine N-methyltransferase [Trypanosoma grayi]KEG11415.1 histone-lysine N-methyltransferase [Trypanosoma grayi]
MQRHVRRNVQGGNAGAKRPRSSAVEHGERGSGAPKDPFVLPLRKTPNGSGCYHCLNETCDCLWVTERLKECYASLPVKRQVEYYRKRELCAKSVLSPFVSRLVRVANVTSRDTFYDLGCGNGSVLFQVALMTGARCVGVEINAQNAAVARQAWQRLRPIFESHCGKTLEVEIICADFCSVVKDSDFFGPSPVIWAANLLLPRPVNHFLSERFRSLPKGSRVLCLEDLYPHARSVAAVRDPDAFEKFDMTDFRWQANSVEWCGMEGPFFMYTKRT